MKNLIALSLLIPAISFASTIVQKDDQRQLLTVKSEIYFYGPLASQEVAVISSKEIETYWNGGNNDVPASQYFTVLINAKNYQVVFEVAHQVVSEAEAKRLLAANPSADKNFIRILQGNAAAGDRSYMNGLGANMGTWYLSDNIGKSTTTAHEFGHGYGIDHPDDGDWRGAGQPSITCPRGTFVDAIYQYNPAANPDRGEPGSTINPYKREVIQWDINHLALAGLKYDSAGKADLNQPVPSNLKKRKGRVY